jgi:hypothetical protein
MTYKKPNPYKTVTWTIKNQDVLNYLNQFTGWNKHPQGEVRRLLFAAGFVRKNAVDMIPQTNFPRIENPFKLSLYVEDHTMLKAAADAAGLKIQQLLEQVIVAAI